MEQSNTLKTGTTTVGIMCKDGIVIGADKRATSGNLIVDNRTDKIYEISDSMVITTAGTVSDAQLLTKLIKAELKLKEIRTGRIPTVKEAANLLGGFVYENIRKLSMIPGISHFILGGYDAEEGFSVWDLFADGSVTKVTTFIGSGSGSVMAYGVLETLYREKMSIDEGIKLAVKSINAALQRDSASGGGIDVVTITKDGVKKVLKKELEYRVEQ
ncbi:proteasome subunit beta [Candidatus Woesearchaeota archaeon]|nr:proteasome subunit beta [Candidatus Woesearchaeota archaeon]